MKYANHTAWYQTNGLHPPDMIVGAKVNKQETGERQNECKERSFFQTHPAEPQVMIFMRNIHKKPCIT